MAQAMDNDTSRHKRRL